LFETYKEDGLRVLGFPCNQFANEEPGTDQEVKEFCQVNYGVTFDLFSKIKVKGDGQAPLYEWLTSRANPWGPHKVRWNFQKYLVDRTGSIRRTYDPEVPPRDELVTDKVEALLAESVPSGTPS
jgi:glutathione peroxidase